MGQGLNAKGEGFVRHPRALELCEYVLRSLAARDHAGGGERFYAGRGEIRKSTTPVRSSAWMRSPTSPEFVSTSH